MKGRSWLRDTPPCLFERPLPRPRISGGQTKIPQRRTCLLILISLFVFFFPWVTQILPLYPPQPFLSTMIHPKRKTPTLWRGADPVCCEMAGVGLFVSRPGNEKVFWCPDFEAFYDDAATKANEATAVRHSRKSKSASYEQFAYIV